MSNSTLQLTPTSHERCGQEQVHHIGNIQAHGLLFVLSDVDLIIRQVGSNVADILGVLPEDAIGCSFEKFLGPQQFYTFRSRLRSGEAPGATLLQLSKSGGKVAMQCVVHRQGGMFIVELEPLEGAHTLDPLDIDTHIRIPLSQMELASDINDLAQTVAREIRRLSAFDRVLVYRFDSEWNGEVIAEAKGNSPLSYFGLRFPANDIPPQVRRLFLANPVRVIADAPSAPVPIVSAAGVVKPDSLDLTRSVLRSSSPVHLEYLRNMEVQASMTISIIVEKQLWGMIACHHPAPHRIDHSSRSVCELIGQSLASQITLRKDNPALQSRLASRKLLEKFLSGMEQCQSPVEAMNFPRSRLLDLFEVDAAVCSLGGVISTLGLAVNVEQLSPIVAKLRLKAAHGIASSDRLADQCPEISPMSNDFCGALYIGMEDGTDDYLVILLRELVKTVTWAGDPNNTVTVDERDRLHPRTSFNAWHETVRGRSRPWTEVELERAASLREQLLRMRSNEQQKLLKEQLLQSQKLESIGQLAAGIAHEINTPNQYVGDNTRFVRDSFVRLMASLDQQYDLLCSQSNPKPWAERRALVDKLRSEMDMDFLREEIPKALDQSIDGLNTIAKIVGAMKEFSHPGGQCKEPTDLNTVIESTTIVCRNRWRSVADLELQLERNLPRVAVLVGEFNQVILNLIVNAADAIAEAAESRAGKMGRIIVSTRLLGERVEIRVQDNGPGIPPAVARKIFEPFFTTKPVGKGTGQGLTLSRNVIVKKHGGEMRFEDAPGGGTAFIVVLPICDANLKPSEAA